ncbi:MAG TPA: MBL fold metallo-hydrolase [Halanaerobiales bacterium]|nr:MBL fold metallo-hydrolase [Halanaerobiales bacterium]
MLLIYHLYHSGVALEIDDVLLVFDYYNDSSEEIKPGLASGVIRGEHLKKYDNVYVFVSHSHKDHYNPVIFQWQEYNPFTYYILSNDIKTDHEKKVTYVKNGDYLVLNDLKITTYGTTDLGVSFLVKYNGLSIFHAGDLNWWHWNSFSREQLLEEERGFKGEVIKLKDEIIDIAFVPVDPRLEENYYLAGEYFIEQIKPSLFVPIHFADNYGITEEFAERIKSQDTEIAVIRERGQKISYRKK